ncbi:ABATE domain-containing protein [Streptomyces sp. RB110-1]|uniref:CGNR zinc finger domain-containing protein n=1 Tax=unclassified Streptomyces TaxID=2593676 RepID=UPI00190287B5|nr:MULTISPECIES: ABATE domain-containing protein [unclassified Streptomyces]MBK0375135.1 ABATE domain-containing protein [Streptomyces sp. RB110-1]MBK0388495.1 ABATE domain-containing protein [Streptomyces sp. RB110-2]
MTQRPVTELANTIRLGGDGGVLDELGTVGATGRWIRRQAGNVGGIGELIVDEELRQAVLVVRGAARSLFARAVGPAPPSPVDAHRLMPEGEALAALNDASARELVAPQLHWPADGPPSAALFSAEADPRVRLIAALARDAVDFLSGPQREQLRACHAPRCARYFVRSHGRQGWCTPACGNRARVARHYERAREAAANGSTPPAF